MRLGLLVLAPGLAALGMAWMGACGGRVTLASSGSASGTGGGGTSDLAVPPPPGPPEAPDGTGFVTFAVTKLFLGDTDPDGTPDTMNGWKRYGYNIDGLDWSTSPAEHCRPVAGGTTKAFEQGAGGIENSYGKNILPIALGLASDTAAKADATFTSGSGTLLFQLDGLGAAANDDPLPSTFALGGDMMATPKLDGTDTWPILQGTSSGFLESYLVGDTWVAWPAGTIEIPLYLLLPAFDWSQTRGVLLPIQRAVVSMKLDATRAHASSGVVSGIIPTAALVTAFTTAYMTLPQACADPSIEPLVQALRQASDILHDGTQDPNQVCDGISIGLGFEATRAVAGSYVPPPGPPPNACSFDGG